MDFDAIVKKAMFNMENELYNGMIHEVFCQDGLTDVDKATMEVFYALNRRGVSSKTIFEAIKEAGKKVGMNE